ncbi:MAG: ParB/RepB/Spo0J family partition protein [Proteobacteria bacterium]|nr:ParB/RepB/Spo0J family partition protein [Pseudomonadota bacterium]MBU1452190.1 ParB/RepB/Spo0J family partition protein [Pseudomonadota bacterium]MBU2468423.1 ParB/RepB/Spo0J family partition protein [Pseudomonadota bacterium]MBU2519283.1 ParB/RepB/Spo0J family partition protein [Pseudomonadota bacterium]
MSDQSGDKKKTLRRKVPALGRGLAALLGDDEYPGGSLATEPGPGERVVDLPVERLEPNPYQPRRLFDADSLRALADSITEHGVLQPLVVRPVDGGYQLIAGERRLRASQLAGLTSVPVVVRQATDQQALLLALLENLQREDLNPLDEANAYFRLAADFKFSQEEIARGVGRDRSTVANSLRLLKLPAELQRDLATGRFSAGHARALLSLENEAAMRAARDEILAKGLSVRAVEALVKKMSSAPSPQKAPSQEEVHLGSLAEELRYRLGSPVEIKRKGKKGAITIRFSSNKELERLLELLSR